MRSQEVRVRHATGRDVPEVLALLARYFAEGDVQHTETEATLLPQIQAAPLGFWVAEQGANVAGCVQCRALPSIDCAAECKRLYVRPESRGCGIAGRLLDPVETAANQAGFG